MISGITGAANGDAVFTFGEGIGDIEGEGCVTTVVLTDILAVYEYLGGIVRCFKVKEHAFIFLRGNGYGLAVPASGKEVLVFNAGKLAFGAEGNVDHLIKLFLVLYAALFACFTEVKFEFPFAAEVCPVFADKLGTGICVSCGHDERSFHYIILLQFHGNTETGWCQQKF